MSELPSGLLVQAVLKTCELACLPYYVVQTGNHGSGLIMVKVNMLNGQVRLYTQERDFMTDQMTWCSVFEAPNHSVEEHQADAHIEKARNFDPDLWVIEVESQSGENPFAEF